MQLIRESEEWKVMDTLMYRNIIDTKLRHIIQIEKSAYNLYEPETRSNDNEKKHSLTNVYLRLNKTPQ